MKKSLKVFLISLVVTLCCSLFNWGIVTGWGNVKITQVSLVGEGGAQFTGLMYVPKGVDENNKAPALLTMHGASGNARNHEQYAVEYARRGFVVLSMDNYGSGDATYKKGTEDKYRMVESVSAWKFLYNCPIIDQERTIMSGHSIGSTSTLHLAAQFNPTVAIPIDGYMGVYPSDDELYYTGMICAVTGDADAQNSDKYVFPLGGLFSLDEKINIEGDPEYNKIYGSFEEKNAKVIYMVPSAHENAMNSTKGMEVQLDFVQQAMDVPNPLPGSNQVWYWAHIVSQVGMLAFAFTLISLYLVLLDYVPAFASVKMDMPRNIGLRGKGFWISVACALIFPLIVVYTGAFGFTNALNSIDLFDMGRSNRAFSVVVGISLLGFLMFLLFVFTDGKKQNAKLRDYGLTSEGSEKFDWKLVGKSLLVALIVLWFGFSFLRLQRNVLGTDFYTLYWGYKPIPWNKFKYMFPYIVVWCLCFILSSLSMNVERRLPSLGDEKKDTAVACLVNIVLTIFTITVIVVVQMYLQKHVVYRDHNVMKDWGADITRLWGMPVGMSIGAFGNTYLYRKTGSIWPGVFLMGTLCALGCVLYGQNGLYS